MSPKALSNNGREPLALRIQRHWYEGARLPLFMTLPLMLLSGIARLWVCATPPLRRGRAADMFQIRSNMKGLPPVVVVGNLIAGGAGKTPLVAALAQYLQAKGHRVGIVTRGYKRKAGSGAALILQPDMLKQEASNALVTRFGDEPVWLAEHGQCVVAVHARRMYAVRALMASNTPPTVIISDDGLQHHALPRCFEVVVFDARLCGNGWLLPYGPLREPVRRLSVCDAIVVQGQDKPLRKALKLDDRDLPPVYCVELKISHLKRHTDTGETLTIEQWTHAHADTPVTVFAGLGNPDKFFVALRACGIDAQHTQALPDHFDYPADFIYRLGTTLAVTTGKDAVKLPYHPDLWIAQADLSGHEPLFESIQERLRGL